MDSRLDHVAFLLRARHAVLGAGSLAIRKQGSVRILTSEIPGTKIRAMIRETSRRTVGGFVPKRATHPDMNLDSLEGVVRFLSSWDTLLMRNGIGASYFPVAALEFVAALIHDERRRDILSIRTGTDAPAGFGIVPTAEWKPPPALDVLIREYADDVTSGPCARQAAWDLLDYVVHGDEKPFDPVSWERLTAVRALRESCASGREIPSITGTWREMLAAGGVRCAMSYLSGLAPNPKVALQAMSKHIGVFMRHHQLGGCDVYVLWNESQRPVAVSAVSADGDVVLVNTPGIPDQPECREDVGMLLDAAGNGFLGRPTGRRGHPRP